MMKNIILIISPDPGDILSVCRSAAGAYGDEIEILLAENAIDGLDKISSRKIMLAIIDNSLPDIPGMSIASIIKDSPKLEDIEIILYNMTRMYPHARADTFFFSPLDISDFEIALHEFLDYRLNSAMVSGSLEKAIMDQEARLPQEIETDSFDIRAIYSPYHLLSGDGLDYWYDKENKTLYGYIFDCVGHDVKSYLLATMDIMPMIENSFRSYEAGVYESLSSFMSSLNEYIFNLHTETEPTPMLLFHIDFKSGFIRLCSAGIPNIIFRNYGSRFTMVLETPNYILGFRPDIEFREEVLDLRDVAQVIFATDGFLDMIRDDTEDICDVVNSAKHDDVSAIIVNFYDAHNGHPDHKEEV